MTAKSKRRVLSFAKASSPPIAWSVLRARATASGSCFASAQRAPGLRAASRNPANNRAGNLRLCLMLAAALWLLAAASIFGRQKLLRPLSSGQGAARVFRVLELPRFCGHLILWEEGVHDGEEAPTIPTGVPPAVGGARPRGEDTGVAGSAV